MHSAGTVVKLNSLVKCRCSDEQGKTDTTSLAGQVGTIERRYGGRMDSECKAWVELPKTQRWTRGRYRVKLAMGHMVYVSDDEFEVVSGNK